MYRVVTKQLQHYNYTDSNFGGVNDEWDAGFDGCDDVSCAGGGGSEVTTLWSWEMPTLTPLG